MDSSLEHDILQRALCGDTILQICLDLDISRSALFRYRQNHHVFNQSLTRALAEGIEAMTDRLATIYEEEGMRDPQRARGISDNVKWLAARRKANAYGDRSVMTVETLDLTGTLIEARRRSGLPIRDQSEDDNTQDAEFVELPAPGAHGSEPVDPDADGDGVDIFS